MRSAGVGNSSLNDFGSLNDFEVEVEDGGARTGSRLWNKKTRVEMNYRGREHWSSKATRKGIDWRSTGVGC